MSNLPQPKMGKNVYIASTAYVGGDVILGDSCTVMHHVVIRGDIAPIRIGARVNVQDGSILHTPRGVPLEIADDVGIGHRAVVHCLKVGARSLIGIGAILLDECVIGSRCIIAAGSVVPPRSVIPDGKLLMGVPAKIIRDVGERDLDAIDHVVQSYLDLGRRHGAGLYPNIATEQPNVQRT